MRLGRKKKKPLFVERVRIVEPVTVQNRNEYEALSPEDRIIWLKGQLRALQTEYKRHRDEYWKAARALSEALRIASPGNSDAIDAGTLKRAYREAAEAIRKKYGGLLTILKEERKIARKVKCGYSQPSVQPDYGIIDDLLNNPGQAGNLNFPSLDDTIRGNEHEKARMAGEWLYTRMDIAAANAEQLEDYGLAELAADDIAAEAKKQGLPAESYGGKRPHCVSDSYSSQQGRKKKSQPI